MILRQDRPTLASVSGICLFLDGINWIATTSFCRNQPDGDNGMPPPLAPRGCCSHRSEVTPALYYPGNQDPHKFYSRPRLPRNQRSTTESTEVHGKENPNQLPLSVSFPGATPARRVGSFRGYPFVMIFLAWAIFGES